VPIALTDAQYIDCQSMPVLSARRLEKGRKQAGAFGWALNKREPENK